MSHDCGSVHDGLNLGGASSYAAVNCAKKHSPQEKGWLRSANDGV
jgi:hypothetical protein